MFWNKLLKGIDRTARIALAVSLTALLAVTGWAGYVTLANPTPTEEDRPTMRFRCMDFKLVEDGSVQALVRLSAENMDKFRAAGFKIKYNPYYIQPAYLETVNGEERQTLVVPADGTSEETDENARHFVVDPAVRWVKKTGGTTYYETIKEMTGFALNRVKAGQLDANNELVIDNGTPKYGELEISLELNNELRFDYTKSERYLVDGKYEYDTIQAMDEYGHRSWENWKHASWLYIDASGVVKAADGKDGYEFKKDTANPSYGWGQGEVGHGVNLGEITFQINTAHLTEMVENYQKYGTASATDPEDFLIGYMTGEETEANNAWKIFDYIPDDPDNPIYATNERTPDNRIGNSLIEFTQDHYDKARVVFEFIFPKALMVAEVAGGNELTVNAYQAYGIGKVADNIDPTKNEVSDLAATVQRYRPEITGTLADGLQTNHVMNWGDETPKATTGGGNYMEYRPYDVTKDGPNLPANGYIDRNHRDTPTDTSGWWVPLKANDYSPKGGKYLVTQYFWYEENNKTKMFPQPMEVYLTVTPVNLVDANADKLAATYSDTEAATFTTTDLNDLDLPHEAVLSLSPVPGPIVLTMPITTWTPNTIGALTVTGSSQPQNWPAVGNYTLKGPTAAAIKTYVGTKYPWVTTDGFNKGINATRTVVAAAAYEQTEYKAQWHATTEPSTAGGSVQLELHVQKTDGTNAKNFVTTPTGYPKFRTYLPGGTLIDTATELPTTPTANNASSGTQVISSSEQSLKYAPGSNTTANPRTNHQEDVSRAINLGGWFYVSVCEGNDGTNDVWSELIPVYVPPRTNYYESTTESYYDTTASPNHYNFNFTGLRAGLYPFYSDSVLPAHVVLPIGYSVATTYDGFTGAEPGELGQFRVKSWASAEKDDPNHTAPSPSPWCGNSAATPANPNIIYYGKPAGEPPATATDEPQNPTNFKDAAYGNYGAVENHRATTGTVDHTLDGLQHVRVQVQAPEYVLPTPSPTPTPNPADPTPAPTPTPSPEPVNQPEEKIRLIHEDGIYSSDRAAGITRDAGNEVTKTTYVLKSEGYVARETFTLTIVNEGTTDIYGLDVNIMDGLHTPAYQPDPSQAASYHNILNHFEVLTPPAAYLPAGGKTTFTVTYVYNLLDTDPGSDGTVYEDQILITSNAHDINDPLKDYIANFEVEGGDTYQVTLDIRPDPTMDLDGDHVNEFPDMGTAEIVVGPAVNPTLSGSALPGDKVTETAPTAAQPDLTATGDRYRADHEYVWIHAKPNDEYKVKSVYYIDGYTTGATPQEIKVPLYVHEWRDATTQAGAPADTTTYFFKMPPKDVTVVVEYYEPIYAKLRLSRLMGYVGKDGDGTLNNQPPTSPNNFLDESKRHNIRWYDDTTEVIQDNQPDVYEEQENGNTIMVMSPEDSSRHKTPSTQPDYVMVLGDYANSTNEGLNVDDMSLASLRIRLRRNYLAPDIDSANSVDVRFYEYDLDSNSRGLRINPTNEVGKTWHQTTGAPTYHNSNVFATPAVSSTGEVSKKAVQIVLTCTLTQAMIDADPTYNATQLGTTIERSFIVVIIRPAKDITSQLNYGNSPKGMIYNNTTISATTQAAHWKNFKDNGYRFNSTNRPGKAAGLDNTYWKEAWGGLKYQADGAAAATDYNGDEDEYALFVILGESFQDPGFKKLVNIAGFDVDPEDIKRSVEVELLDKTATTQTNRFNGARTGGVLDTVTLTDLGTGDKGLVTSTAANDVINNWWTVTTTNNNTTTVTDYAVRPGLYKMTYTFPDYNGTTQKQVTRPLIILAPVGDVNADRAVNNSGSASDATYIQNRVTDPLGGMKTPSVTAANAAPDYDAWRLFRYRCCDSNNDRNINNIDANLILRRGGQNLVRYYKPTDYITK